MPDAALTDALAALARGKPVILYGPPGTGKTKLMNELRMELEIESGSGSSLSVNREDLNSPITRAGGNNLPQLPGPVRVEWVTFHQGYGYEDFVLGLMPQANGQLIAVSGPLLEAVADVVSGDVGSVVLFIDELNRANVARVFGELITFLDPNYRTKADGGLGDAVPFQVKGLPVGENGSYEFHRRDGRVTSLPRPLYFPRNVYLVATMNSVDRTALPVDAAIGRRFERIALRPSAELVADSLGTDLASAAATVSDPAAAELAVLVFDRVNSFVSDRLDFDSQIGHGTMIQALLSDPSWPSIESVARVWDDVVVPHIEECFAPYPQWLRELLRVDDADAPVDFPYVATVDLAGASYSSAFDRPRMSALTEDLQRAALAFIIAPRL